MELRNFAFWDSEIDTMLPLGLYNASSPRNFKSPIARMTAGNLLDGNIFSLRLSRGENDGLGQIALAAWLARLCMRGILSVFSSHLVQTEYTRMAHGRLMLSL
jgi:hypothetical protein